MTPSTIMLLEDGQARCSWKSRGYPQASAEQIISLRLPLDQAANLCEMFNTGKPVIVQDTIPTQVG